MTGRIITAVVREGKAFADSDALVPWWSYTKTVLAAAALVLVASGKLRLDDPITGQPFTLRQLLQHRAGVPEYGALPAYHAAVAAGEKPWSARELLDRTAADTLLFKPGEGWRYSNIGYLYVRQLLEAISGRDLGDALNKLVFGPLAISSARIAHRPEDLSQTAWGNAGGYDPRWVYHGLLIGSAADATLFLHRLLIGDLIPVPLLAEMRTAYRIGGPEPGRPWLTTGYGLGLMIGNGEPEGLYIGHTGGGPGSTSAVYYRAGGDDDVSCDTAGAFAPLDDPAVVECRALELARGERNRIGAAGDGK